MEYMANMMTTANSVPTEPMIWEASARLGIATVASSIFPKWFSPIRTETVEMKNAPVKRIILKRPNLYSRWSYARVETKLETRRREQPPKENPAVSQ